VHNGVHNIDELFWEAVQRTPGEERDAYLAGACGDDQALRQRVERLLQVQPNVEGFLERPFPGPSQLPTVDARPSEEPGTVIGPYKLLAQIGEGGMGLVFVAEQEQPIKRRVALKIIKPGMDSRQVIARFEAERQALAMMDHPNIAKVMDAGTIGDDRSGSRQTSDQTCDTPSSETLASSAAGRPYFVMELVKGTPITDYCDTHRLTTGQRLRLFMDVCHAVQHAHQKGIIHRDIKPSNILVTVRDSTPVVKVIDFGIAKAIAGQLTDNTVYTGFAQMVGTPLYMSPEQAGLNGQDVDTRGDVYSLGVLLYELLTGTTPFDSETLKKAGYDEMRRMIREQEPPRPSARLSTMQEAHISTIAEQRGLEPRRLSQHLRGELDWIVMKALEKDRNRRYESASAFAADVQRFLKDEPVLACPPSAVYRLKKFTRRNKARLLVASGLLAALVIMAGSIGSISHDRANRRDHAEATVVQALAILEPELAEGNPHAPNVVQSAQQIKLQLATGLVGESLRQRAEEMLADLAMLARLEQIRLDQAAVKENHFDAEAADSAYASAFQEYGIDVDELETPKAAAQMSSRLIAVHLAAALDNWAVARKLNGAARQEWLRLLEVARAADPEQDEWRTALREVMVRQPDKNELQRLAGAPVDKLRASTLSLLGETLRQGGSIESAVSVLAAGQRRFPADFWLNHDLAFALQKMSRQDEAIGYYRAALALRPQSPGVHLNLGNALNEKGKHEEAIASFRMAIELKPDYAEAHFGLGTAFSAAASNWSRFSPTHPRKSGRWCCGSTGRPGHSWGIGVVYLSLGRKSSSQVVVGFGVVLVQTECFSELGEPAGPKKDRLGA
jgi:serine/threonine-protein kinase